MQKVESFLNAQQVADGCVTKISGLTLPADPSPLVMLVYGDSQQLPEATKYAQQDDPCTPSAEEVQTLRKNISKEIIKKLQKYLADWNAGNVYHFIFELRASYGRFVGKNGDVEYITIHHEIPNTHTIEEAAFAAREWERTLLDRVILYTDEEIGHKYISVRPVYTILDTHDTKIAAGFIAFGDHRGVSTWVNQL